jgi:hypothetical protein
MDGRGKNQGERRRAGRFRLQAGVQIATATMHGEVLEVSRGGLVFSYPRKSATCALRQPAGAILFGNGGLYVSACVIIPVWEEELAREASSSTSRCRCGVRFHDLSPVQERDLGRLIRAEASLGPMAGAPSGDQEKAPTAVLIPEPGGTLTSQTSR